MIRRFQTVQEVRAWRSACSRAGNRVALVPTMGALHRGHLELVRLAHEHAEETLVSIFVNPTQFGPSEDFDAYPRDIEADVARLVEVDAAAVFAPSTSEIYARPQTIWVEPGPLGELLCGRSRPGHFRGVLTVVNKLFAITTPDCAVFGRKDLQQVALVRQMIEQFCLPIELFVAPCVREDDGLALSSRNKYLSDADRTAARGLSAGIARARDAFRRGEPDPDRLRVIFMDAATGAGVDVEYAAVVDPVDLSDVSIARSTDVLAVAGRVGRTRLIDNETLGGESRLDELELP